MYKTGIITCGIRPLEKIDGAEVFIDKDRKGAAFVKNELLHKFYNEGVDYIFLFDDDCYPVIGGWADKIINWAKENDVHYLGGIDFKNAKVNSARKDVLIFDSPYIGAYYFFDRKCIENVGYYNPEYIKYGWEDVLYSIRVYKAFSLSGYPFPLWMNMYIHAKDMFSEQSLGNMTFEEKQKYIKMNIPIQRKEFENANNGNWYIGYNQ